MMCGAPFPRKAGHNKGAKATHGNVRSVRSRKPGWSEACSTAMSDSRRPITGHVYGCLLSVFDDIVEHVCFPSIRYSKSGKPRSHPLTGERNDPSSSRR
jgi:hypothetical protein